MLTKKESGFLRRVIKERDEAIERARQWEQKAKHLEESERDLAGILSHVRDIDRVHAEDEWRAAQCIKGEK